MPALQPADTYVARLGAPDCEGVQILRLHQAAATSCIQIPTPGGPGGIAMSLVNGGGWLTLGDKTLRSTDDLVTWRTS